MLTINLKNKVAFVAGVADDQGFGWAIAKALAEAGAEVIIGCWPPALKILQKALQMGKFDESRKLSNGKLLEFKEILPFDATFDSPEDVPESIKTNKRYQEYSGYTISETAAHITKNYGKLDLVVHSLANGPEVRNSLLQTSRSGYLAAVSASAYSFVSLMQHFGPIMNKGGSALNLTYMASERVIPGYGGGMSSAKAALESDTRTLAWEAGREFGIRVNSISAGAYASRAAKAIGFIEKMKTYSDHNAPIQKDLVGEEVGHSAAFLLSDLASAISGVTLYVDNGMHAMGVAVDSPCLQ